MSPPVSKFVSPRQNAKTPEKDCGAFRNSLKNSEGILDLSTPVRVTTSTFRKLLGSCTGRVCNNAVSSRLKIAALAPIPTANVKTATQATKGVAANCRQLYRRSRTQSRRNIACYVADLTRSHSTAPNPCPNP